MNVLIFSDSHGNYKKVHYIVEKETPDMVVFCGDGYRDYTKLKQAFPAIEFVGVRGNCDYGARLPESLAINVRATRIYVTHGHLFNAKYNYDRVVYAAEEQAAGLLCFGHTHTPYKDLIRGLVIINPGAASDNRYAIAEISDDGKIDVKLMKEAKTY